jgi:hypothetical protein
MDQRLLHVGQMGIEELDCGRVQVPLLAGAMDCVRGGFIPGGLKNNREFAECLVGYEANVPEEIRTILFDPQTARRPAAVRCPLRCRVARDRIEQCRRARRGD